MFIVLGGEFWEQRNSSQVLNAALHLNEGPVIELIH